MTRLLLDTQLVLWWLNDDPRLSQQVVERVQAPEAEVFVSQASLWEMAIKVSIGRLQVDLPELERPSRMEGWLPDHFVLNGGGLACIGIGEDGATYLASCLFDPVAQAQQPAHTDFSSSHWQWDAAGVRGTAARMEQLAVHAFLVQLYAQGLVAEGEIPPDPKARGFGGGTGKAERAKASGKETGRAKGKAKGKGTNAVVLPPVWLGRDYRVQGQPAEGLVKATDAIRTDPRRGGDSQPAPSGPHWRRGYWRALSPLKGPVAAPLEWVEPQYEGGDGGS